MLREVGDGVTPDFTGKRVVIIGGGNVAMDCARSARRMGAERVTCVYRRREEDMTALHEEIEGAMAEGCEILTLQAPLRIEGDEEGRRRALAPAADHRRTRCGRPPAPTPCRRTGTPDSLRHRCGGNRAGNRGRAV